MSESKIHQINQINQILSLSDHSLGNYQGYTESFSVSLI